MARPLEQVDDDPVDGRAPLILGGHDLHSLTEAVAAPLEQGPPRAWWLVFGVAGALLALLGGSTAWLFWEGIGIWGLNNPVGWGWDITNFVFWVGIGHAGTLISAILFLFRQSWRTSINRSAEAMTIFAVMCALIFPGIHVGRIWVAYWMAPLPNQMGMWPNFRSPLLWDVFAVSIYGTVSLLFWYVGMIPDLALVRDRAKTKVKRLAYGFFALGWRFSARHWQHYEKAYLLLAALATPLVLSVHSIVSMDFAVSQLPGWHTTIFPPYFVAGAIFSGFAMVMTLMIVCRQAFKMTEIITVRHLENMAKIMLLTGSMVGYAYGMEFFIAWYSGNPYESFIFINRAFGDYAWAYWTMIVCNVVSPQLFWFKRLRTHMGALFVLSIVVNIGMWFERFVIIVTSLHHDFLPSSWDYFRPTVWDVSAFLGSFGLFFFMFCLFVRFLPMVAVAEVKSVLPDANPHLEPEERTPEPPSAVPAPAATWRDTGGASHGVLAEFADVGVLLRACRRVREAGYTRWDAHAPYPVHGLPAAMGLKPSVLPWFVLVAGLGGAVGGFALQTWVHSMAYPLVISGKPFFSWPAYIPITFELGVLGGAATAVVGMLALNRLPMHHHPLFSSERFEAASDHRFFVSIESSDPMFGRETGSFLARLGASSVESLHAEPALASADVAAGAGRR